jgi:hypothetical protein
MAKLTAASVDAKLREHHGNVAAVGRAFGVTRQAVADFIKRRPVLQAVCTDCRQTMMDDAESALYAAVLAGEPWAVKFYLRTQARERGYTERYQFDHSGDVRQRVVEEVIVEELVAVLDGQRRPAAALPAPGP